MLNRAVALIWSLDAEDSETIAPAFGISLAAMIACAHASLMLGRLRPDDGTAPRTLTKVSVGSASCAALLMSCLLPLIRNGVASGIWRLPGCSS